MTSHKKMESYTMTAMGDTSGAAISSAISGVRTGKGGSHIVVLGVVHTPDGHWQAMVMVVIDPELESKLEERLRIEHDREEYERTHGKEEREKDKQFQYLSYIQDPALKNVHMYFSTEDYNEFAEELFPIKTEFDNTNEEDLYFHSIERDSTLWTNVQEMALEYDFHNAVLFDALRAKPLTEGSDKAPLELNQEPAKYRIG